MIGVLIVAVVVLALSLVAAILVCCQKRRWGFALAGLAGLTVSGYVTVGAVVAGVKSDGRFATFALLVVLLLSLGFTTAGARGATRPNSLWARHHFRSTAVEDRRELPSPG